MSFLKWFYFFLTNIGNIRPYPSFPEDWEKSEIGYWNVSISIFLLASEVILDFFFKLQTNTATPLGLP